MRMLKTFAPAHLTVFLILAGCSPPDRGAEIEELRAELKAIRAAKIASTEPAPIKYATLDTLQTLSARVTALEGRPAPIAPVPVDLGPLGHRVSELERAAAARAEAAETPNLKPDADYNAEIDRVRDATLEKLEKDLANWRPTDFTVARREDLQRLLKEVREHNAWRFDAIRTATEAARPHCMAWLRNNPTIPRAERERMIRVFVDDAFVEVARRLGKDG